MVSSQLDPEKAILSLVAVALAFVLAARAIRPPFQ